MSKNLILLFHPNFNRSILVKEIGNYITKSSKKFDVEWIENKEDDFIFDVWLQKLQKYENIVFCFPFWWYSIPWNFKKWLDLLSWNLKTKLPNIKSYTYFTTAGVSEKYQSRDDIKISLNSLEKTINYILSNNGNYKNSEKFVEPTIIMGKIEKKELIKKIDDFLKKF